MDPGALVYVGDGAEKPAVISLIEYDDERFSEGNVDAEACAACLDSPEVSWINVDGVRDTAAIERVGHAFSLHPLTVEDILNTEQRPKFEEFDRYVFLVMKMLRLDAGGTEIVTEQVSLVLGPRFVLSVQEDIAGDVFDSVRARLRSAKGRIRGAGPDYLCYALVDAVVDNYFLILESVGDRIERIEDALLTDPQPSTLEDIHRLKRDLIFLRKSVWPLREVITGMQRDDTPIVTDATRLFLRDVHDHTIQVIDGIETSRDILAGMLDLYMSSMSNRMNEVMKVLTIIATVFIPLTFIAGVYGMNFEFMPELHSPWGYPAVWTFMLAIGAGMYAWFRRKRWL